MHPDSSRALIHEKIGLQLYSHHARTETKKDKDLTFSLILSSYLLGPQNIIRNRFGLDVRVQRF